MDYGFDEKNNRQMLADVASMLIQTISESLLDRPRITRIEINKIILRYLVLSQTKCLAVIGTASNARYKQL